MQWNTAIKMKALLIHAATWMNLQSITLSERSQTQKTICSMISEFLEKAKPKDRNQVSGCQDYGWGKRIDCREAGGNFQGL